jgi:hypothetical protein
MPKVLILYYSTYGHMEQMAYAAAEGVQRANGEAVVKRVPELVPEEIAKSSHFKLDQAAPVATVSSCRIMMRLFLACRQDTGAWRLRCRISGTKLVASGRRVSSQAKWAV